MLKKIPYFWLTGVLILLVSCWSFLLNLGRPPIIVLPEPGFSLTKASFADLKGWNEDVPSDMYGAYLASCRVLMNKADFSLPHESMGRLSDWKNACEKATRIKGEEFKTFLEKTFTPYKVFFDGKDTGTFTGYYQPEIPGSLTKTEDNQTPVYSVPSSLVRVDLGDFIKEYKGQTIYGRVVSGRLKKYYTREEIETMLQGEKPIAWVKDPVDLFILHIQGSGIVLLPDGTKLQLNYAANNGHNFVGIGSLILSRKIGVGGSMPAIADWLRANRDAGRALMNENPRFIFFKPADSIGAIGAMGIPLTAERSMAVDPSFIPLGSLLWLETVDPGARPVERLMVAQDTGSAIKGAVRGDFFWGTGALAFEQAGRMKSPGNYFILIPNHSN